jgi:pyruvate carboxylase
MNRSLQGAVHETGLDRITKTKNIIKMKKDYSAVPKEDFVDFVVESFKYKTLLPKKYLDKKNEKYQIEKNKQFAVLPGTITNIMVKEGEEIELGDSIMTFEAMKMNNVITATFKGKVKKIHVKIGDVVTKKQLLIEYE